MNNAGLSFFFRALCPMFLVFGLLTIVNLIVTTPFNDIRGPVRDYIMQCTLKILPYWLGAFIVDFCIWIILTTIVWALFNLGWIDGFHDNLFSTWWVLVFQPFMIMEWCDIIIYGVILIIIESSRRAIAKAAAKRSFSSYSTYINDL